MIIPSSSSVLISNVNYASLILGVSLGNSGIKVLITDEGNTLKDEQEYLIIDNYSKDFLVALGFVVSADFSMLDLFNQSKQLLANQFCSIHWQTQISKTEDNEAKFTWLKSPAGIIKHETRLSVDSEDLFISDVNTTIKHIAFYYWKLEGVLNDYINPAILTHQKKEKDILAEYYSLKPSSLADKIKKIITGNKSSFFHLRESRLNLHLSQDRKIEAGDLLPDLRVYDEKKKQETSFYQWCKPGMFCMIMIGSLSQLNLFNIAKWLKANFPLHLFYLPPTEKNEHIFKFFNIIEGEKKTLIVRPDRYIGLINDRIDLEIIDNYLTGFLFLETKSKPINQRLIGNSSIENYP